jgi:hypothetical protein
LVLITRTSKIIAQGCYAEKASHKVANLPGSFGETQIGYLTAGGNFANVLKWGVMVQQSHDHDHREYIDKLFYNVKLCLMEIKQSDPAVVEELKAALRQLEDCVDSLIIDWLKLRGGTDKPEEAVPPKKTSWEKRQELIALVSQVESFVHSLKQLGSDGSAESGHPTAEEIREIPPLAETPSEPQTAAIGNTKHILKIEPGN